MRELMLSRLFICSVLFCVVCEKEKGEYCITVLRQCLDVSHSVFAPCRDSSRPQGALFRVQMHLICWVLEAMPQGRTQICFKQEFKYTHKENSLSALALQHKLCRFHMSISQKFSKKKKKDRCPVLSHAPRPEKGCNPPQTMAHISNLAVLYCLCQQSKVIYPR